MVHEIPDLVKNAMAEPRMRYRHLYWHLFKDPNVALGRPGNEPASNLMRAVVAASPGWRPLRLRGQAGHGIDFIHMHRMMIKNVNAMLSNLKDPHWPSVQGWQEPPILHEDPDWPMPQRNQPGFGQGQRMNLHVNAKAAREPSVIKYFQNFDSYAAFVEDYVHDGLHGMFSKPRPSNMGDVSINGDWLGSPFSSHVNSYFWKLHGWVDDCVGAWETATGQTADLSSGWNPPPLNQTPLPDEVMAAPMAEDETNVLDSIIEGLFSGPPNPRTLQNLAWP